MGAPRAEYAYTTIARLREEGFATPAASPSGLSDERLRRLISQASRTVNLYTSQWFWPAYDSSRFTSGQGDSFVWDKDLIPIQSLRTVTFHSDRNIPRRVAFLQGLLLASIQDVTEVIPASDREIQDPDRRMLQIVGDILSDPFIFGTKFIEGSNNVEMDGYFGWLEDRHEVALTTLTAVNAPRTEPADGATETVQFDHLATGFVGYLRRDDIVSIHDATTFANHVALRAVTVDMDPILDVTVTRVVDQFDLATAVIGVDFEIQQFLANTGITFTVTTSGTTPGGTTLTVTPATATTPLDIVVDIDPGVTPTSGGGAGVGIIDTINADATLSTLLTAALPTGVLTSLADIAVAKTTLSTSPAAGLRFRKLIAGPVYVEVILGPATGGGSDIELDTTTITGATIVKIFSDPVTTPFTIATFLAALAASVPVSAVISAESLSTTTTDVIDIASGPTQIPFASFTHEPLRVGSRSIAAGGLGFSFGRTPETVEYATIRLIVRMRDQLAIATATADIQARLIGERTDSYEYRLAPPGAERGPGGSGTGDEVADRMLQAFRQPPLWVAV